MKVISIPVSKPTACYLISLYGEPPLKLPWSSSFRSHLSTGPSRGDVKLSSHHNYIIGELTVTIDVKVSDRLADDLETCMYHVGWHLHNTMMDAMCEWVRAYKRGHASNTIAAGVRDFYDQHHISIDVLDPDSAYKRYDRYMINLRKVIEKGYLPNVYGFSKAKIPLSFEECEQLSEILYHRTGFFKHSPSRNSLYSFLAGAFAKTKQRVIAKKLGISQEAVGSGYRRLARRYVREEAFADLVLEAISDVRKGVCVLDPVLPTSAYS